MFVSLKSRRVVVAVATLIALSACGRRGDLEPPSANAVQAPSGKQAQGEFHKSSPPITPPNKSFVLDPVLQ